MTVEMMILNGRQYRRADLTDEQIAAAMPASRFFAAAAPKSEAKKSEAKSDEPKSVSTRKRSKNS